MKGFIGMLVWLLASIGAINWGLEAYNYSIFTLAPLATMPEVVMAIKVLVGISGIISLVLFVGSLFSRHSCTDCHK